MDKLYLGLCYFLSIARNVCGSPPMAKSESVASDSDEDTKSHGTRGSKKSPGRAKSCDEKNINGSTSDEDMEPSKSSPTKRGRSTLLKRRARSLSKSVDVTEIADSDSDVEQSNSSAEMKGHSRIQSTKRTRSRSKSLDGSLNECLDSVVEPSKPAAAKRGRRSKSLGAKSEDSGPDEDIKPAPVNGGRRIGAKQSVGTADIKKSPRRSKSNGKSKSESVSVESNGRALEEHQTVPFLCQITSQDVDDKKDSAQDRSNITKSRKSSVQLVKASKKTRKITPKKAETKTPTKRKIVDDANDNNTATAGSKKNRTSVPSDVQKSSGEEVTAGDADVLPAERSVGGEQSASSGKMMSCPVCFRTFTSRGGFKYHTSEFGVVPISFLS